MWKFGNQEIRGLGNVKMREFCNEDWGVEFVKLWILKIFNPENPVSDKKS
jgi:hypothetical protein